jgi:hypothetical protein
LRAKTDFPGDNQRTKFSLRKIIVCRDFPVIGPMIKPVGLLAKYILYVLDSRMSGLARNNLNDSVFNFGCLLLESPLCNV